MSICVYIDGQVRDPQRATVSVFDRGFLFGDSVYETVAYQGGHVHFLSEHLDRLERSARSLYLDPPVRSLVVEAIRATVAASAEDEARVRVIVTRGVGPVDIDPATATTPQLIVIVQPLGAPSAEMIASGIAVEVVNLSRGASGSLDPAIKSGNYLSSVLAIAEARHRRPGAGEAILCTGNGGIAEGATSNVFLVQGGVLVTPGLEAGILEGVTRGKVLGLARGADIAIREPGFVAPRELLFADEVFLTSAVRGILPVTRVDGRPVGDGKPGPVTLQLLACYRRLISEDT
jgi:branched-chain amino acid aminotransferase